MSLSFPYCPTHTARFPEFYKNTEEVTGCLGDVQIPIGLLLVHYDPYKYINEVSAVTVVQVKVRLLAHHRANSIICMPTEQIRTNIDFILVYLKKYDDRKITFAQLGQREITTVMYSCSGTEDGLFINKTFLEIRSSAQSGKMRAWAGICESWAVASHGL